jgi:hypothetical protein
MKNTIEEKNKVLVLEAFDARSSTSAGRRTMRRLCCTTSSRR